jgi:Spy/CpxP family protein refolding chaperone
MMDPGMGPGVGPGRARGMMGYGMDMGPGMGRGMGRMGQGMGMGQGMMGYGMGPGMGMGMGPGMGMGHGMGMGMGRGMGPGMMGYCMGGHMCERALLFAPPDVLEARFDLDDDQIRKVLNTRNELLTNMERHRSKMRLLWLDLRALLRQDAPPEQKVVEVRRKISDRRGKMAEAAAKARLKVLGTLTEKQRTDLRSNCIAHGMGGAMCAGALMFGPPDALKSGFGLTDSQIQKIESIRSDLETKMEKHRSKLQSLYLKKRTLMQEDMPPEEKVLELERDIASRRADVAEERIKAWLSIMGELTPQQRANIRAACAPPGSRMGRGPGRRGMRRGPPGRGMRRR